MIDRRVATHVYLNIRYDLIRQYGFDYVEYTRKYDYNCTTPEALSLLNDIMNGQYGSYLYLSEAYPDLIDMYPDIFRDIIPEPEPVIPWPDLFPTPGDTAGIIIPLALIFGIILILKK